MKKCTKCNILKPLNEFSKCSRSKDNFSYNCKDCIKLYFKKYRENRKDIIQKTKKKYYIKNKKKIYDYHIKWKNDNPEYFKEYMSSYFKKEVNRNRKNKREYNRRRSDINYRISCNLRKRLYNAVKRNTKSGSAVNDLGCSIEFLKVYLENMFTEGMSWDNYGKWHIDHIYPLSKVDLTKRDELLKVCHYTNLQPLWAKDNIKKGNNN